MSDGLFRLRQREGVKYWSLPSWRRLGCQVCFSCRVGGASQMPFASLNLGLATRDRRERILSNRRLFLQAARLGPLAPIVARQSHEANLREVRRPDAGRGWGTLRTAYRRTDGMITAVPGLPLAVTVADCLPILIADARGRAVAAVHAGWRGLTNGVIPAAVTAFQDKYRILPADLWVAIGPSIGPKAFWVKGEARQRLRRVDPLALRHSVNKSETRFDLWKAAVRVLRQAGVKPKRILVLRHCTVANPHLYFSHRRDGETGRMLGVIQLLPTRNTRKLYNKE
jgi:polyphenol oxidase